MNKFYKIIFPIATFLLFASFVLAAGDNPLQPVANKLTITVKALGPVFWGLISAVFLYGVIKFMLAGQNEKQRDAAKWIIIYSVIGMAIAVSIWGIVTVLRGFFGVGPGVIIKPPLLPETAI